MYFTRRNQQRCHRWFTAIQNRIGMPRHGYRRHCKNRYSISFGSYSWITIFVFFQQEVGHAGGALSHANGYKIDISLNPCVNSYITGSFKSIGNRGDGAAQYQESSGNIYAREGNHWDITFTATY